MHFAQPPNSPNKSEVAESNQPLEQIFSPEKASFLTIDESASGQRLDNFLLKLCKGVPKSHIYRIVRNGEVRVNKGRIGVDYRLQIGDVVRIPPLRLAQPTTDSTVRPCPPAEFPVLFEDAAMLAINKPAGVAVHGGSGVSFGVIEQLRAARLPDSPKALLELVHRLDRETSGILLVAKKRQALVELHRQIREGEFDKRYLALVKGKWPNAKQTVRAALYKYNTAEGERRVMVRADGLPSQTVFHLRGRYQHSELGAMSLLEAELLTGRTHQIRVHLQHLGFPILGDDKYGDFSINKQLAKVGLKRMFLHAFRLQLKHPMSAQPMQLEAPLPLDCSAFLQTLNQTQHAAAI